MLVECNNFISFKIELNIKVFNVSFSSEQIAFHNVQFSLESILLRHYYCHFKPYLLKIVLLFLLFVVHLLDFVLIGLLVYEEFSNFFFRFFIIFLIVFESISFFLESYILFDQQFILFLNNFNFFKSLVKLFLFLFVNFFKIFYITHNGHQKLLSFLEHGLLIINCLLHFMNHDVMIIDHIDLSLSYTDLIHYLVGRLLVALSEIELHLAFKVIIDGTIWLYLHYLG